VLLVYRVPDRGRQLETVRATASHEPGGTIGRAPLGYLNHVDRTDGRDIRTIIVDPERASLVQLGFELFSAGNLTLDQLSERLYQRVHSRVGRGVTWLRVWGARGCR